LDNEDVTRLLRGLEALNLYSAAKKPFTDWTEGEAAVMVPLMEAQLKRDQNGK
jgi:hypothetical protein